MPPDKKEQKKIEKSLEERKRHLLQEIRRDIFEKFREEHGSRYDRAMDSGDMSVASLLESVGYQLAGIREEELREIVETERKIQDGNYGICERCGRKIREERLDAEPYAVYCIGCQKEMESMERPKGRLPDM